MLDDLKLFHKRDKSDALGVAEKQWEQLGYKFEFEAKKSTEIKNIVFCGMGGSALAAIISRTWPGYDIPFEISRDYSLPKYANQSTLVIASSYSGDTEETLSAYDQAKRNDCQIAVISSGGSLAKKAGEDGNTSVLLPSGFQPRMATLYSLKAVVSLLVSLGLANESILKDLESAGEFIKTHSAKWVAQNPTNENRAKQLAQELMGKSPVIYGSELMFPAAYKWKISFNENAKNVAWCNSFPEFNHNEFLGWSSHPVQKSYSVIFLKSTFDNPRVNKRFEITEQLLSGQWPSPITIEAEGDTILKQILWLIVLGDFTSLYLAFLNGLDPTPVDLISKFKSLL